MAPPDGAAVGILAVAADQTSTTLTFYKSGTFRYEDCALAGGCQRRDEKTDRVCRNGNQHRLTLPFITKGRLCGFFYGDFLCRCTQPPSCWRQNEQKFKFDPLFLRLFFRESYPFTTEKVYLSQIPGLVNMALYVSPIVSGEVIRSRGGSTSEFTPGYVKPKHEVNPQMTLPSPAG
ncbi:phage major head protein (major coat protein) [Escherichia coli]|nr:phage major head protein (major coat protein) [Escherichia coli]